MISKKDILKMKTIAVYSKGYNGIEVKEIEYGIDDHLLCVSNICGHRQTAHRLKIYYTKGRPYVKIYGCRVPLDECLRV